MAGLRAFILAGLLAGIAGIDANAAEPFTKVGVDFLERHCTRCHGEKKQKAGLKLDHVRDDLALLRARRNWKEVLNMVETGQMPPEEEEQPSATERKAFLESVHAVFVRADNAPPDPGRITVRRLNRAEYNNTIRDLLKVDFHPAENFPTDDVGFGFNNIGDVLSVSPVLMERYLEAAEQIAEQAIPITAARPSKRIMAGRYCEPASPDVPTDPFRPINAAKKDWIHSGPLNTPANIKPDGEYFVRARLYARSASGAPVRVALLAAGEKLPRAASKEERAMLDGQALPGLKNVAILKTAEITAREESKAQLIEVKIRAMPGIERIAIAAFKPPKDEPPPTLFVEYLEHEGPLDVVSPTTKALMVFSPGKPEAEQAREVLWRFASRAWRRPVEPDEIERLMHIVNYAVAHNEGWEGGLRRAVTAILASPKFIFRLEPDHDPENPDPHPITDFQLATRLSYFLWSSCPDDELLQLAHEKKLAVNLDAQIQRMLKDPKSRALVDEFMMQWLQLGRITGLSPDKNTYAKWSPELRASMLEETNRFCTEIVRSNRSILDLLTADFTWVDSSLAELYGINPPGGIRPGEWKRVSLAGTGRGGLLTHASVLTVTSNPSRTSPVKRGKWILEQLLGAPPPPPPPDIPSLEDPKRSVSGTFRQRLEQHRADPQCSGCHAKMDAFGLAMENFNGIGQWRERDETGAPVDASAKLPDGEEFRGLDDLKAYLQDRRVAFARCLTEKMLIYALGRGLDYYDEPAIDRIQAALVRDDYRFSTLITQIVKSDPFRLRRGKSQLDAP